MTDRHESYGTRLWKFWIPDAASTLWLVLGVMPLLFFQTFVHEGMHVLSYVSDGRGVDLFAPFPHLHHTATGDNVLNGVSSAARPAADTADIAVPQFVDIGLLIVLSLFLWLIPYVWPMRSRTVRLLFRLWYLGVLIDLLWNTGGRLFLLESPTNDWYRYQQVMGYSPWEMWGITFVILLVPLTYFAWGPFSGWHREQPESQRYALNFVGGFWDYRWAAFVFGLLSLAAILFSLLVSDPSIEKQHGAFIAPLALQFILCPFYWIYFGLSFRYERSGSSADRHGRHSAGG